ncbi:hypothetical protein IFM89_016803 [Coptis chinensis]|uniref:Pentatricopeptide repeat-containing protein n=1 Tax=Coptis chinensis TaxID=261450 RepID=A0A835M9X8_9MAGN|nr:hypothetical protein IFM89_016803 [Coptis chinensis]
MNSATGSISSPLTKLLRQTDTRSLANHYASQLQLCCPPTPTSHKLARTLHAQMITSGFKPRGHILNRLIDIYSKSRDLNSARLLFDAIPEPDIVARTTLIAALSNAGDLIHARDILNSTPLKIRDTVSYNAMITGYSHNNDGYNAVKLFSEMRRDQFRPDTFTFSSVLSALALVVNDVRQCQQLHCGVVKSGTETVVSVLNALVSLYVKCAMALSCLLSMDSARKLFNEMRVRDELTWTTMITGYVRIGEIDSAKLLFDGMTDKLQVAWNAMISGYVYNGRILEAIDMFRRMHLEGIMLDEFTFTSVLSACANYGLSRHGKQLHGYILRTEFKSVAHFVLPVEQCLGDIILEMQ